MIDWQPIGTAPKDESWVLLFFEGHDVLNPIYKVGFWSVEYQDWYDWEGASSSLTAFGEWPTHWAALAPPK